MKWILILSVANSFHGIDPGIYGSHVEWKQFDTKTEMTEFLAKSVFPKIQPTKPGQFKIYDGTNNYGFVAAFKATPIEVTQKFKEEKRMTTEKIPDGFEIGD